MNSPIKILILGGSGLLGHALLKILKQNEKFHLLSPNRSELNLLSQQEVMAYFKSEKPDFVILAAAKVGGIGANLNYPADFIYENLCIEQNVIHQCYQEKVKRLLFIGSACIYPRQAPQPIPEQALLSSALEPSNEFYAIAKIAGIKMCQAYNKQYGSTFLCPMPNNLYGPFDHFNLENSHVIPALIKKFHEASENNLSEVEVWGSGEVRREFLFVDDFARACLFLLELGSEKLKPILSNPKAPALVNVGTGEDCSIADLVKLIQKITNYSGKVIWNKDKPEGVKQKLLDSSLIHQLGYRAQVKLEEGLQQTYEWYSKNKLLLSL